MTLHQTTGSEQHTARSIRHWITALSDISDEVARFSTFSDGAAVPRLPFPATAQDIQTIASVLRSKEVDDLAELTFYLAVDNDKKSDLLLPEHIARYAKLANEFGMFERTIDLLTRNRGDVSSAEKGSPSQIPFGMLEAKALRSLGRYDDAKGIYLSLLDAEPGAFDAGRLLLNLGKFSQNNDLRIGSSEALIKFALARFNQVPVREDDEFLRRQKQICEDCIISAKHRTAFIENFRRYNSPDTFSMVSSSIPSGSTDDEAMDTGGNRWRFRKLQTMFAATSELGRRHEILSEYHHLLGSLSPRSQDIRGLAVRLLEFAQMLLVCGENDDAMHNFSMSLLLSSKIRDWKTYARAQIQLARAGMGSRNNYLSHTRLAQQALSRLANRHPELEFELFQVSVEEAQRTGNAEESMSAFRKFSEIVDRLRERIDGDLGFADGIRLADTYLFLTHEEREELHDATVADYRFLSNIQQRVLKQLISLVNIMGRREQMDFLALYSRGIVHRIRNVFMTFEARLLSALAGAEGLSQDPTVIAQQRLAGELVKTTCARMLDWESEARDQLAVAGDSRWVALCSILESVRSEISFEILSRPLVDFLWPAPVVTSTIELLCYPLLVKQAIVNFVENAARVVEETQGRGSVSVFYTIDTDDEEIGLSIIVEDSAADPARLRAALDSASSGARLSGLYLSQLILKEMRAEILLKSGENTTRLEIRFSPRVVRVREVG